MARVPKRTLLYIILTLIMLAVSIIGGQLTLSAFAATDSYTNVLTDLEKAENFDATQYPDKNSDYSINVIQVAESSDNELFIYTYQPCQKSRYLVATEINMSLSKSVNGTGLYQLILLNTNGVFGKYKVKDFKVKESETRYYNITSIYREANKNLDGVLGGNQTVNAKSYEVGQLWKVTGKGDNITYEMTATEVVDVTKQMVGFRRYADNFQWANTTTCDAHYYAFSCNYPIDNLLEADVDFYTESYKRMEGQDIELAGDKTPHSVTVHWYDEGAFNKTRWQRLSSTKDFVSETGVEGDDKKALLQYDWIINFYETDFTRDVGGKDILITCLVPFGWIGLIVDSCTTRGTVVSEVTLLRLKFDMNDKVYNLGVVSDKQTGGINPTNPVEGLPAWAIVIIVILVLILIVLVLSLIFPIIRPIIAAIFKGMWTFIKYFFIGLWWLICLPFKAIASAVKKRKEKKAAEQLEEKSEKKPVKNSKEKADKTKPVKSSDKKKAANKKKPKKTVTKSKSAKNVGKDKPAADKKNKPVAASKKSKTATVTKSKTTAATKAQPAKSAKAKPAAVTIKPARAGSKAK